jgi:PAS domain S-box-containing protein
MTSHEPHDAAPSPVAMQSTTFELLSAVNATLSEAIDHEQLLGRICALTVPGFADSCLLHVVEGQELRPAGERHVHPDELSSGRRLHRAAPVTVDSSEPQAQVLRSGEPLLVADVTPAFLRESYPDSGHRRRFEALEPRSLMALPLVSRGSTIGVLTLVRRQIDSYGAAELSLAQELAGRVAMAVDNARLQRALDQAMHCKSETELHLHAIFRQAHGWIWTTDRALNINHVAGNLPTQSGRAARAFVASTVHELVGSRNPTEPGIAHHLAALSGESQSFECEYQGRRYELLIEPLRNSEQQIVGTVGVAFDVTERRATEERLARNEARLAEAQRVAHVGSFEWDIASDLVTWTDELHRIYGLEPGQFEGSFAAFLARVHPADVDMTRRVLFDALRAHQPFVYDHRVIRPDGSGRTLHTRGEVIEDAGKNPIRLVGTCWDVTELTEATQARQRSLSLLRATVEATADGILAVDRRGRVTLANQRLHALWNLSAQSPEWADERTILDLMLAQVADPDGFRAGVHELQDRPELERLDVVRLKDGRVFERYSCPQRIGDAIVGRVWSYRDISERERLLRQAVFLADATRLLACLDVEQALDAVAHLIVPFLGDGCAVDLLENGSARRLLAVSRDPNRPISGEPHSAALAGHPILYCVGSTSYLGVPLSIKGEIVGVMTLAAAPPKTYTQTDLDLADEVARRAALAIDNARLYQRAQQALQSRDDFLSVASHEIRGPVTSLHLAVQMLQREQVPEQGLQKAFDIIERQDRRLAAFVDELLDLSRIRTGTLRFELEQVDLGEIVRTVASTLAPELAKAGSSLSLEIGDRVVGDWDRVRIDQIVTNLLSNAIKFGLGKPIRVQARVRGESALLVVSDQGVGIAADLQSRIFLPFERAVSARHYGGLGLGLYIVRTIVDGLGGRVTLESTPGNGSTFTVELPLVRSS